MSGPLKKARAVYPLEEYNPEEENVAVKDDLVGQTIDVDFDAFKAEDGDFHGIKRLLQQTFRGLDVDISGIADIIISQNYVGSVVKQANDDDDEEEEREDIDPDEIFSVSTVINLTSRKDEEPVAKVRSALVDKCQEHGNDAINTLLRESLGNESKNVGLLISERLVNLPAQFAIPVFESLLKELSDAKKKGMPYHFSYIVMICKIYKEKKKKHSATPGEVFWSNPEEEVFGEESIASFEYSIKGASGLSGNWDDDDTQCKPWRKVLVLDGKQLPSIINKVRQAIF